MGSIWKSACGRSKGGKVNGMGKVGARCEHDAAKFGRV